MAGVTEKHAFELFIRPDHGQDGHDVVDRPLEWFTFGQRVRDFLLASVAAVNGECCLPFTHLHAGGGELRKRFADHRDARCHRQRRLLFHQRDSLCFDRIVVDQVVSQPRPAVVVRESERHLMLFQHEPLPQLCEHMVAHSF